MNINGSTAAASAISAPLTFGGKPVDPFYAPDETSSGNSPNVLAAP